MTLFEHVAWASFQLASCPEILQGHILQAEKIMLEQKERHVEEWVQQLHHPTYDLQQLTFELHHNLAYQQVVRECFHDACQDISESLENTGSARVFSGFLEDCKVHYWRDIVIGILGFMRCELNPSVQITGDPDGEDFPLDGSDLVSAEPLVQVNTEQRGGSPAPSGAWRIWGHLKGMLAGILVMQVLFAMFCVLFSIMTNTSMVSIWQAPGLKWIFLMVEGVLVLYCIVVTLVLMAEDRKLQGKGTQT